LSGVVAPTGFSDPCGRILPGGRQLAYAYFVPILLQSNTSMTNLTPAERFSVMERRLAEGAKRLTLTEAAATTGLSIDEAEAALRELLMRYDCVLQVTENGDLIYDFGPRLHRRDEKSFREYLGEFLELLWKGFVLFFKAWIAVTLVVYFLIFLTILVTSVIVLFFSGDNKRKGRHSRSSDPIRLIYYAARLFAAIFEWGTANSTITYQTDKHGYRYATYQPRATPLLSLDPENAQTKQPPKKGFIASVYDFVFGPPRVTRDPLENQKEIAAYVRQNKGILFVSEIKALTGLDSTPAALLFSDCIGRFQGDIRISDRKLMYGQFDRLLRTAGEHEGKIVYYWDEYEPPYFLTGNTVPMNILIVFLNGFNLLFSLVILSGAFEGALSRFWLGVVPLLFSTIFFAVPLLRLPVVLHREAQRNAENQRRRVMKAIFLNGGRAQTPEQVLSVVNQPGAPEPLSKQVVEDILARLVRDLPGEIRTDAQGQVLYEFPIITLELEEAKRLRAQRQVERNLGKVIFDSRQE